MVVLLLGLCISVKHTVEYGSNFLTKGTKTVGHRFLFWQVKFWESWPETVITITYFIHTSVLKLGFSVLRAPKMTSPSMNDTNPISLCQAFKAAIPAALTAFCDRRKNKFLIYLNTLCIWISTPLKTHKQCPHLTLTCVNCILLTLASARVLNIPGPRIFKCLLTLGPMAVAMVAQMFRLMVTWQQTKNMYIPKCSGNDVFFLLWGDGSLFSSLQVSNFNKFPLINIYQVLNTLSWIEYKRLCYETKSGTSALLSNYNRGLEGAGMGDTLSFCRSFLRLPVAL